MFHVLPIDSDRLSNCKNAEISSFNSAEVHPNAAINLVDVNDAPALVGLPYADYPVV